MTTSKGYNFIEGRYMNQDEIFKEGEEERELINETNDRIFKLHKAIIEK